MCTRRENFERKLLERSENAVSVVLTKAKYDKLIMSVLKVKSDGKHEPKGSLRIKVVMSQVSCVASAPKNVTQPL